MGDRPVPDGIIDLSFAFFGSKALLSAVELGLFTELADGPLDAETLRQRLGLHPRASRDFFDALFGLGLLEREDGRYRNTAETDLYLDRNKPSYVGAWLEMTNDRLYPFFGALAQGLRPVNRRTNRRGRRLLRRALSGPRPPPAVRELDDRRQHGHGAGTRPEVPVGEYRTFVDVGTAQGNLPVQLALATTTSPASASTCRR